MTGVEIFHSPPVSGLDQWLFAGRYVERRNPNVFHSPGHAGALALISARLVEWTRAAPTGLVALGYGVPYRPRREPETVVSFDATLVAAPLVVDLPSNATHIDGAPWLAVEVVELDEDMALLEELVHASLAAGVRVLWIIDPFLDTVTVHRPGAKPVLFDTDQDLSGDPELPGFRCRVADIFE